jgi:hypothetical protein
MFEIKENIESMIKNALSNKWAANKPCFLGFMDSAYYLPSYQAITNFLFRNPVNIHPSNPAFRTEGFDCDDYAFVLKGNACLYNRDVFKLRHGMAVGIIWGNFNWMPHNEYHAANWVITSDSGMWLIEPQNNQLFNFDQCLGNVQLVIL